MGGQDASLSLTLVFLSCPGYTSSLGSVELCLFKVSRVRIAPKSQVSDSWQSIHLRDPLTQHPVLNLDHTDLVNGQGHLYSSRL